MTDEILKTLPGFFEFQTLKDFQQSLVYRSVPENSIDLNSIIPDDIEPEKEITIGWYFIKYCNLESVDFK